jgi:hypothetical protein
MKMSKTWAEAHKVSEVSNKASCPVNVDTEIALIKKDMQVMKDNHLYHIEKDMEKIHTKVDKLDNRLWWVLGILIASTVGTMLTNMIT